MNQERHPAFDDQTQGALDTLQSMIAERYPAASFEVSHGDDPEGVYLRATVDIDDVDEVLDTVLDPLFTYQVEEGLPIYVVPLQPIERVLQESRRPHRSKRLRIDLDEPTPQTRP